VTSFANRSAQAYHRKDDRGHSMPGACAGSGNGIAPSTEKRLGMIKREVYVTPGFCGCCGDMALL